MRTYAIKFGVQLLVGLFFIGLSCEHIFAQAAWERVYEQYDVAAEIELDNGDFLVAGRSLINPDITNQIYIMGLDPYTGDSLYSYSFGDPTVLNTAVDLVKTDDGGVALLGYDDTDTYIIKLDSELSVETVSNVSTSPQITPWSMIQTTDGGFLIQGTSTANPSFLFQIFLLKVSAEGIPEWQNSYIPDETFQYAVAFNAVEGADGNFFFSGYAVDQYGDSYQYTVLTSPSGEVLWSDLGPGILIEKSAAHPDGGYILAGEDFFLGFNILVRLDADGVMLWFDIYPELNSILNILEVFPTDDGGYGIVGSDLESASDSSKVHLCKFDEFGVLEWQQSYSKGNSSYALSGSQTSDGGYLISAYSFLPEGTRAYVIRTNSNGRSNGHRLSGNLFLDYNEDCIANGADGPLYNWFVEVAPENGDEPIYLLTGENGEFIADLDTGSYTVTVLPPNDLFSINCESSYEVLVSEDAFSDTTSLSFAASASTYCPYLTVGVATPFLRRCFESTYYVSYCNFGTSPVSDSYVTVTLDDYLTLLDSEQEYTLSEDIDNAYDFQIGDLDIGECGTFKIKVDVSCDALLGQTHCTYAHAYPDSLCTAVDDAWDRSSTVLSGECIDGEVIEFTIANEGTGDMAAARSYEIYEDDLILTIGNFTLNAGEQMKVEQLTNGSTYRMNAQQSPSHPGDSHPRVTIEGCGEDEDGNVSLGFVNTSFQDDGNPFEDTNCTPNIGSFDANTKVAAPIGLYEEHYIDGTEELEYLLYFQNVGTDTAFTVVVHDTLSPLLDITSLRLGASSHPFDFSIRPGRVLEWRYDDIYLPDSLINEPESHGFAQFFVTPKADLAEGTVIYNDANIYFDRNAPILTNETFHTIGDGYEVYHEPEDTLADKSGVSMYPNPFRSSTTLTIGGAGYKHLYFYLYEVSGRAIKTYYFGEERVINLELPDLAPGMYFYRIKDGESQVATGKLLIE